MIDATGAPIPNKLRRHSGDKVATATDTSPAQSVLDGLDAITKPLESLYRDIHSHPELSTRRSARPAKPQSD